MSNTTNITHSFDKRSGRGTSYRKIITTINSDERIKFIHSLDVSDLSEAEKVFDVKKEMSDFDSVIEFTAYCLELQSGNSGTVMFNKYLLKNVFVPGSPPYSADLENIYVEYKNEFYYLQELLEDD